MFILLKLRIHGKKYPSIPFAEHPEGEALLKTFKAIGNYVSGCDPFSNNF